MTKFYIFLLAITLIPLLLLILSNIFGFFQPKTVQIRGKVVCTIPLSVENTFTVIPAAKARITLFEGDILFNDQLNSTIADEDGFFQIEGKQYEPNFLTPIVQLEHPCGNSNPLSSHCVFVQQTEFDHSGLVDAETKLHSNGSGKAEYVIWTDEGNIKCGLNAADKFT